MSFIRAKEIPPGSGNFYDYEVENHWDKGHVRQKVIRYIGKSSLRASSSGGSSMPVASSPVIESPVHTIPLANKSRITKMKTPSRQIASAMGMYYGGMSLDAIQQQFRQDYDNDMSETNYWNWVKRFTREAIKQTKDFKPVVGDAWVADETYMKFKDKTVYFWDIIDSQSRYLLASHVSFNRGAKDAKQLMKLAEQRAGKAPKFIITDRLKSYISGIEDTFGAETKHRQGNPFEFQETGDSTAQIERFHRTLEQRTKVFQKYQGIQDIKLLTDGWLINYNFFKQNEGCGNVPPAQAMSKAVPIKDWNDVVIASGVSDMDYKVSLHRRKSVTKGYPVYDATLTPVENKEK